MLRAGVIGLGVGEQHANTYAEHPAVEVVALCDLDPDRLSEIGERHPGARAAESAEALIDDPAIDVVSIASYDSHHHAQVMRAIERGKHVFVEKPLCQYEHEAREIHAALRERPELVLSSNLPLRMSPRFQWLREQIAAGGLGRVYYLEGDYDYGRLWKIVEGWRGQLDFYSVTLGGALHVIDLLLWLTGDRVVSVTARGTQIASAGSQFRFDDLVLATLELESGALAKVSANFGCVHPHFHGVKVFGTEATFINGLDHGTLWTGSDDAPAAQRVEAAYPGVAKGALIPSFIEAVLGRGPAVVSADEVFTAMSVCFAIDRATATSETVEPQPFAELAQRE